MQRIQRSQLANGVTIISEELPGDVVSCGIWFREGSSAENNFPVGITHVLEHMLFKGTPTRNAFDLSSAIEGRGGMLNAGTSRCDTCLYSSLLAADWKLCFEVLADMALNSSLDEEELEKELSVVCDEIRMVAESPEEELSDLLFSDLYPNQSFGQTVQGTEQSVTEIDTATLKLFLQHFCRGHNMVVALCGPVTHLDVVELADRLLGALPAGLPPYHPDARATGRGRIVHRRAAALQTHLHISCHGPVYGSDDYSSLSYLNTLIGEGMSSRLFQDLREERALCYNTYSWIDVHDRVSTFGAYVACEHSRADEAVERIRLQFEDLHQNGPTHEELERTRLQLLGGLAIASEQSMNRLMRLARRETAGLDPLEYEEIATRIRSFRHADLAGCASRWLVEDSFCESRICGENND